MKRKHHDRKWKPGLVCSLSTILFSVILCLFTFSPPASATDKIHVNNVPYVVQKERLD